MENKHPATRILYEYIIYHLVSIVFNSSIETKICCMDNMCFLYKSHLTHITFNQSSKLNLYSLRAES